MEQQLYWHFAQADEEGIPRLRHGDDREVRVGETLRVGGEPVLCEYGLHASARLWNALEYSRGHDLCLCRVTLGGTILHDNDKSVGTERTVVAMLDADTTEKLLRSFARWCALQVIHLWDAPDIVLQYLETGDESLRDAAGDAARDAVGAAARDAAWATARAAAWEAARATARATAWDAAGDAAWDAVGAAARAAAWAAAWATARAAAGKAARATAWDAAWDAIIESYADELERRALALLQEQPCRK